MYKKNLFTTSLADFPSALPAWAGPLCGLTGVALFLAGTMCFVAYNWAAWGTLYKFALPLIGLAACAAAAYRFGLESSTGQVLSFACGLFVGLFWVVYGQVYQTGSFVYEFCLVWAVCLLPLALLAGNRWLWVLWAVVCNGYMISRFTLWMASSSDVWILIAFNVGCFAVSEWVAQRRGKGGWLSLFFLAAALCFSLHHILGLGCLWGWHFWCSFGMVLLLGVYAWRFRRGAAQLGFCALALDLLLMSKVGVGGGILEVLIWMVLFVGSGGVVYVLSRGEDKHA